MWPINFPENLKSPKPTKPKIPPSRDYIQYPRVPACGHKYDPNRQPRMRNCDSCWFAFFVHNEQLVKDTDTMFRSPEGGGRIVELQGIKYFIKFGQFMGTMAKIQEQVQAAQEEAISVD